MTARVLELREVSKYYDGLRALERVNLTIRAGRTTAIIGPVAAANPPSFA